MLKRKSLFAALALGALTYAAYLAYDFGNPSPANTPNPPLVSAVAAPALFNSTDPAPSLPVKPLRPRAFKRIVASQALPQKTEEAKVESQAQEKSEAEPESKENIPMPGAWSGDFVKQELLPQERYCDLDRPCSPRGRDGVLLVGAALSLNGFVPQFDRILSIGSYQERTPLLVYK